MNSLLSWIDQNPIEASVIGLFLFFILLFIHDVFIQKKYAILHNFPIVGHLRYLLTMVGPEMRQYWVANDKEEQPFNRSEREWIYSSAENKNSTFGFGTSEVIYSIGYPIIKNAGIPYPSEKAFYLKDNKTGIPCLKVMGEFNNREKKFRPKSIINISGMSYGSLGKKAISSLNLGAKLGGCYHNTGEGSVSDYHLQGADIMWQIGTGYFGCRDLEGNFSIDTMVKRCQEIPQIKAIEIKLSQGAKPGKGGILPGTKVNKEIARVRGIPLGKDCISPNAHSEFSNPNELIDFIEKIAKATGLPVGIKAAIGQGDFWEELSDLMLKRNEGPDFITIDGGEGGTGAAPLTFADHVSLPFKIGFSRVYQIFQKKNLCQRIVWIGSGKLGFPDRSIVAMTLGCDIIHIAREAMMSIGCIQAQKCHTDHCPAGIATQNAWLEGGISVERKALNFSNYLMQLRKELLQLSHAAGYEHPGQFTGEDIEFSNGVNHFSTLREIMGYEKEPLKFESMEKLLKE
ncbi:FMN-binding glutamate synthase family protein [Halobacteriovorax sp. GB3]|uniref:FMN-binding glutamate synthase family protein n=1 Tax=Halobacteriovorax sp. GB3 TaxID=2719615 RepID=UPI0023600CB5|nr:FMN-binding glutamate synthase family protein [Halobacteriovorax sp. GB3]MDD0851830.1 FMN-binding glutamate synthase family protein [Halobacteriovorax sp. GB3]